MGRDPRPVPVDAFSHGFNPRARVGRDAAPRLSTAIRSCFNPRARVGRDACARLKDSNRSLFQSTRPRGARRTCSATALRPPCFNPRARVGRDSRWRKMECRRFCFNPRARVGRDNQMAGSAIASRVFQSTRPRGARRARGDDLAVQRAVSIHAPAWGATHDYGHDNRLVAVSIHAPAWGATVS